MVMDTATEKNLVIPMVMASRQMLPKSRIRVILEVNLKNRHNLTKILQSLKSKL